MLARQRHQHRLLEQQNTVDVGHLENAFVIAQLD